MRKNPDVCFQVDKMENTANWKNVIAWGYFEELADPTVRRETLEELLRRNLPLESSETLYLTPQWPFPTDDIDSIDGIVCRIRLKEVTGRHEKQTATAPLA